MEEQLHNIVGERQYIAKILVTRTWRCEQITVVKQLYPAILSGLLGCPLN